MYSVILERDVELRPKIEARAYSIRREAMYLGKFAFFKITEIATHTQNSLTRADIKLIG